MPTSSANLRIVAEFNLLDDPDLRAFLSIGERAEEAALLGAKSLASAIHAKIVEEAHARLHQRLPAFLGALREEDAENAFLVVLDAKAKWIDDGMDAHSMLDDLLSSPKAKVAKDGTRYLVVPFEHSKTGGGPQARPLAASNLADAVKAEMKRAGLSATRIERHASGQPVLGRLHTLTNVGGPKARDRLGLGRGRPLLDGLTVYQHAAKNSAGAVRSLVTFRVASSKQEGSWQHPGLEGAHIFETAAAWAEEEWSRKIFPEMLEELTGIRTMR